MTYPRKTATSSAFTAQVVSPSMGSVSSLPSAMRTLFPRIAGIRVPRIDEHGAGTVERVPIVPESQLAAVSDSGVGSGAHFRLAINSVGTMMGVSTRQTRNTAA